jgi:hypothetical protein
MPSIQYASGEGHVTNAFWKAKGTVIHANLDAADRTLVTDNGGGGGAFPLRLRLHGYSTGVHLPTDAGGASWAQQAAYEASLAVSTDVNSEFSEHTFWLHHSAVTPDPLRPPSIAPPPTTAAAGNTRRTAVQLKKQFAAHDSVAEFREAMEEGFELNGWDNATTKQRTHELLNNIHPDIALALITDGAKDMDTTAVFALMATLPQPRQKLVLQQLEVARRSATDGEPWAEFASKLYHDIVRSRGHSTMAQWIHASDAETVCTTVIALLTHAAPPRIQAPLAAELDTMLSSTTDLGKLAAARKRLLDLGAASSSLATTAETPSSASVFAVQQQQSPPVPTPGIPDALVAAIAKLTASVARMEQSHDNSATDKEEKGPYRPKKYVPGRHRPCRHCRGPHLDHDCDQ